jgi:hypothetical protein
MERSPRSRALCSTNWASRSASRAVHGWRGGLRKAIALDPAGAGAALEPGHPAGCVPGRTGQGAGPVPALPGTLTRRRAVLNKWLAELKTRKPAPGAPTVARSPGRIGEAMNRPHLRLPPWTSHAPLPLRWPRRRRLRAGPRRHRPHPDHRQPRTAQGAVHRALEEAAARHAGRAARCTACWTKPWRRWTARSSAARSTTARRCRCAQPPPPAPAAPAAAATPAAPNRSPADRPSSRHIAEPLGATHP